MATPLHPDERTRQAHAADKLRRAAEEALEAYERYLASVRLLTVPGII